MASVFSKQMLNTSGTTASGNSDIVEPFWSWSDIVLWLDGTANVVGTLDVILQHSPDYDVANPGAANWENIHTFTQITASANELVQLNNTLNFLLPHVRVNYTIAASGDYDIVFKLFHSLKSK